MLPEPKISYKPFWGICRPLNSWRANSPNPIQIYCARITQGGSSLRIYKEYIKLDRDKSTFKSHVFFKSTTLKSYF